MALVDYTSSDEIDDVEEEEETPVITEPKEKNMNRPKRKYSNDNDLPPLPAEFHDLYASGSRLGTRDDPALHEHSALSTLISTLSTTSTETTTTNNNATLQSSLTSDLGAPLPLHISLSRTLGLTTVQKDDFATALETAIKNSRVRPFTLHPTTLSWEPNYEKTRWFLVLRVRLGEESESTVHEPSFSSSSPPSKPDSKPNTNSSAQTNSNTTNPLPTLLSACNSTAQSFAQPALYVPSPPPSSQPNPPRVSTTTTTTSPSPFHISIAWTLTPPATELSAQTAALNHHDHQQEQHHQQASHNLDSKASLPQGEGADLMQSVRKCAIRVESVKAKIGNVVRSIALERVVGEQRLFGF